MKLHLQFTTPSHLNKGLDDTMMTCTDTDTSLIEGVNCLFTDGICSFPVFSAWQLNMQMFWITCSCIINGCTCAWAKSDIIFKYFNIHWRYEIWRVENSFVSMPRNIDMFERIVSINRIQASRIKQRFICLLHLGINYVLYSIDQCLTPKLQGGHTCNMRQSTMFHWRASSSKALTPRKMQRYVSKAMANWSRNVWNYVCYCGVKNNDNKT
jgi:hypothetical protein